MKQSPINFIQSTILNDIEQINKLKIESFHFKTKQWEKRIQEAIQEMFETNLKTKIIEETLTTQNTDNYIIKEELLKHIKNLNQELFKK